MQLYETAATPRMEVVMPNTVARCDKEKVDLSISRESNSSVERDCPVLAQILST
jgi:hypothetical protein